MGEIATTKDFQERMFERIRDQLGDLMTQEDLQKIVTAAIDKAFFEKQKIRTGSYSSDFKEIDPVFVIQIRELMTPMVRAACEVWVNANKETISKAITDQLNAGAYALVQNHINSMLAPGIYAMQQALREKGIMF